MGLDLKLIAVSNKANFIIEKSKQNSKYAIDSDKICDLDVLRRHLKMVQANPSEKEFEESLMELIKDSEFACSFYPDNNIESYRFHSSTRGYATLNYLLLRYLFERGYLTEGQDERIFYGGHDIDYAKQHTQFKYLDNKKTSGISVLLKGIDFNALLPYYDYEKMKDAGVYKLTRPENLEDLRTEFEKLKEFYKNAQELDAFILAIVD